MTDFEYLQAFGCITLPDTRQAEQALMKLAESLNAGKRTDWNGLTLVTEYPKGSVRSGKSKAGKEWSVVMKDHYGYFEGKSSGADTDDIDFFLSELHPESKRVFVINQVDDAGKFDEHKCVLGCETEEEAKETYLRNYSEGWTGLGSIKEMTLADFKAWLDTEPEKKAATEETAEEFWKRNETEKENRKNDRLPHVRDGAILCDGCQFRYHAMPEDDKCPKCGHTITTHLRSARRPVLKSAFENCPPQLLFVKQARDSEHPFTICVDLDGTLAETEKPFNRETVGEPRKSAIEWVRRFYKAGARIIIFTVRGTTKLVEKWLKENDVPFDYVNENPDQPPESSGKVFADVYWDDRAFNAEDPDEHGPEILRRVKAHSDEKDDDGVSITIIERTVTTISAPDLLDIIDFDYD